MLTDSPVARLQVRIGQKIGTEDTDLRRSITGGLTNAVGGCRTPGYRKRRLQPGRLRERAADGLRGWLIVPCGILWRRESR